jgi:hypothetical protein
MICNRFVVGLKVRFEFEFIGIAVIIVSNMKTKKKMDSFLFFIILSNYGDNYFKFIYVFNFEFDGRNSGGLKNDIIAIEHIY